jgi:peptidoglycan L-alanyl-D-glutamate endopeptidase CwlK
VTFAPGVVSRERLQGCDLDLARTIRFAYTLVTVDFSVFETLRSFERQKELVTSGASRTMASHHLAGSDGKAYAADLVPFIGGRLQWQTGPCVAVAQAMHRACRHTSTTVTWGAVWDRLLRDLDPADLEGEIERYVDRYRAAHEGARPLVDYPHFQVPRQ